ncbi:MAG: aldehyde dehydrogenase family protein [Verrucomicrobiota bacterium]|nr:aldehyde dehydrogenase family protein [Verrucomicrobiota bacterium]
MAGNENLLCFIHQSPLPFTIFFFEVMRNPQFVVKRAARLSVLKTYKLYIGGKFVRSESGRVAAADNSSGAQLANYSRASRKDVRDAVTAARKAFPGWAKQSAYLRGQILYRAAEMLEMRKSELQAEIARANGDRRKTGADESSLAIDRLVHYAGWTDKYSQLFSTVNPVASSHFNFTTPEPTGVVVVVCPDEPSLVPMVSLVAAVILAGNTAVVLPSMTQPLAALTFCEIIATSDLPGGVVNMVAGERAELAPYIASHMDVNAIIDASGDNAAGRELQKGGGFNVKRYAQRALTPAMWRSEAAENPYWILDSVEMKTAWHPIGL